MKVFISWSGSVSKQLAEALSGWFKEVIQVLDIFFSPEDIKKGTRWASEIAGQLKDTDIGILVLTPDNISAPWILFEAGALSKHADESRVSPILFGLSPTDLTGPLAQFMATPFNKEEMLKLVMTIRERLADERITKDLVEKTFNRAWPELETAVKKTLTTSPTPAQPVARKQSEVLDEILQLARTMVRQLEQQTPQSPANNPTGVSRQASDGSVEEIPLMSKYHLFYDDVRRHVRSQGGRLPLSELVARYQYSGIHPSECRSLLERLAERRVEGLDIIFSPKEREPMIHAYPLTPPAKAHLAPPPAESPVAPPAARAPLTPPPPKGSQAK